MEDVGTKKFVLRQFFYYMMVDLKTLIRYVQEFKVIMYDIHAEGMTLR